MTTRSKNDDDDAGEDFITADELDERIGTAVTRALQEGGRSDDERRARTIIREEARAAADEAVGARFDSLRDELLGALNPGKGGKGKGDDDGAAGGSGSGDGILGGILRAVGGA